MLEMLAWYEHTVSCEVCMAVSDNILVAFKLVYFELHFFSPESLALLLTGSDDMGIDSTDLWQYMSHIESKHLWVTVIVHYTGQSVNSDLVSLAIFQAFHTVLFGMFARK